MFGGEHAAAHRVVHALDARHVDEARRAADQRAAGKAQPRHRLIAALGDGARAIGKPLAAFEQRADRRMGLEALEFVERRQIRIVVIEMHDEADRHQIVVVVIEERAAAGRIVQRPAERMLDQALLVLGGIDLPDFLQPDAEFRRLALGIERDISRSAAWSGCRARLRRTACICRAVPCRGCRNPCGVPSLAMPMSPVAMPRTAPLSS